MGIQFAEAAIIAALFSLGVFVGYSTGEHSGAIAAHKGEIVCVQLAFKEERWECGEL